MIAGAAHFVYVEKKLNQTFLWPNNCIQDFLRVNFSFKWLVLYKLELNISHMFF